MKLSAIILLVGLVAVPVVLFAQFRWVRAPDFRRRRGRLLLGALFFFPLLAVAHAMAVKRELPPPEPSGIRFWPDASIQQHDPLPPPPPPPRPVERQEDCPPGTTLVAAQCRANPRPTP
ncbi:MAG TPA: hypothetical protein VEZ20_02100 [Allosphingosinicella sp.]|nr:hypothetical protein [Allosphingosinicella sp.]